MNMTLITTMLSVGMLGASFCSYSDNAVNRGIINDLIHINPLLNPVKDHIKNEQFAILNNPYRYLAAQVRDSKDPVATEEIFWRKKRLAKVKKAQEQFLGMSLADDEVLEVAFSCSGGGFRAMLGALGSLCAAEKTGLLDCVMTIAGLSGSTWCLGPWITSGMSLADYKEQLLPRLTRGLEPDELLDVKGIVDRLLVKFAYEQPLSTVDLYGTLLGNTLFSWCQDQAQNAYLYAPIHEKAPSQAQRIAYGDYPFPVYTAVLGNVDYPQEWFEITPFEVGCRAFQSFVPAWAFGRLYDGGRSIDDAPEQSMGYILGICGSAFGFNLQQAYDMVLQHYITVPYLRDLLSYIFHSEVGKVRFAYAEINNFMYNMPDKPLSSRKVIKLVDAGLDFMNPIFATYRKQPEGAAPDMVVVFDYSESGLGAPELSKAAAYAKRKGLAFPRVTDITSGDRALTIFGDTRSLHTPIVAYLPRIKDRKLLDACKTISFYDYYTNMLDGLDWHTEVTGGYAMTINMYYTKEQAETTAALTEFNLLASISTIRDAMRERVLAKREQKR